MKADAAKTGAVTQAQEKGPSDLQNKNLNHGEQIFAQTCPLGGSKNVILCFFRKI